jgi:hypothetical protein
VGPFLNAHAKRLFEGRLPFGNAASLVLATLLFQAGGVNFILGLGLFTYEIETVFFEAGLTSGDAGWCCAFHFDLGLAARAGN